MSKVLLFVPVWDRRLDVPWLDPVRDAQGKVKGVKLLGLRDEEGLTLSGKYALGFNYAMDYGFDWVLLLEDDEKPTPDIAEKFLAATKQFPEEGLFMGVKRLRTLEREVHVPFVLGFRNDPPAINEKPITAHSVRPNSEAPRAIIGGAVCTPMFYSPAWFKKQDLHFHGNELDGPQDTKNWDMALSQDLFEKRLRFVSVPQITVEHWDERSRTVLT